MVKGMIFSLSQTSGNRTINSEHLVNDPSTNKYLFKGNPSH